MITATIAHTQFVLNSLEDAEMLLRILSKAERVDRRYDSQTREHTFVHETSEASIDVSVFADQPVLTVEEYAEQTDQKIKAA